MIRSNGITLISLVITIIVLLILAGISISFIVGDNGIINQAGNAKIETEIASIKEEADSIRISFFPIKKYENLSQKREELILKIKEHFNGTIEGNRIVTEDEKYIIFVKEDAELSIEVIQNQEGKIAEGELDLHVELIDGYKIHLMPVIGGEITYKEFATNILKNASPDEKIDLFMEGEKYWDEKYGNEFPYTTFEEYMIYEYGDTDYPTTLEELTYENWYDDVDKMLIAYKDIKPADYDFDNAPIVYLQENDGWSEEFYYSEFNRADCTGTIFYATENKEYTFTATYGSQSVTKSIVVDNIEVTTIDNEEFFEYDSTSGYLTGVNYDYYTYLTEYGSNCDRQVELNIGLTKLVVPSSINGVTIVGIERGALSGIYNLVEVELPDTIEYIGRSAFSDCINLKKINIPDKVTTICEYAFSFTNISEIFIPIAVTTIKYDAFRTTVDIVINCEATSKPSGWASNWKSVWWQNEDAVVTVNWGQTRD